MDVRHSIPEPRALAARAAQEWHLAEPVACTLWRRRLADVYRLRARGGRIVWLPWVRIEHHAGASSGGGRSPLRK